MGEAAQLSRRELFSKLFRRLQSNPAAPAVSAKPLADGTSVAIIQGRFCLAYRNSFCTVCSERCPEPGAIKVENALPRVVADRCTGCGICHEVCPAPRNGILMMRRK